MRLIDADKLRTIRSIQSGDFNSIETIQKWIGDAPTVDAVPVRHGHWIDHEYKEYPIGRYECSVCGAKHDMEWYYCPICGAKMGGERRTENADDSD